MVNTSFATQIKGGINDLLNIGSNNFIKDTASTVSESTMSFIKSSIPSSLLSSDRTLSGKPSENRTIL